MRILGIDYGEARTGLAVSDDGESIATVIGTVRERDKERLAEKIAEICRSEHIGKIVSGLPKNMDGTEGFRAEHTRKFCAMLQEILSDIPIEVYEKTQLMLYLHKLYCRIIWTETANKKGVLKRKFQDSFFIEHIQMQCGAIYSRAHK